MENTKSTAELENFKPFDNLSNISKSLLGRGLHYVNYSKKTTVLIKSQRVSGAYVVVGGQLRVFTLTPSGKEATLYLINPGETCVLALNCIFNELLYPAWVEAKPNTSVAVIPGPLYRILFESEPAVRNMTVQAFSTIVFRLMAELEEVHSYNLEKRLASFLLLRSSADAKIQMTQQEIASHLGTTREVIARVLGQMVSKKYIKTSRNQIVINDPSRLAELINQ
ncbi:Crp/Fnr family transcriptional regulator [Methylobacter luteus]|uniref:Crp/Fnr family transcriptional regulator n=1 Tax=Methylobacter luteus TaxID=415 RepID=UPI000688002C|nr:Crp/Fnr family transcriptional regulator [Methylobacter luteus]